MAKTLRNVYVRLCSFENLWEAYRKARRGKRYGLPAAWFDRDAESRLLALREEFLERRCRLGAHQGHFPEPVCGRLLGAASRNGRTLNETALGSF